MRPGPSIDLNCDMGEGSSNDERLFGLITSANIACGGHAGDDASMRQAVRRALERGVRIGAHPGTEDREGFGRRGLDLPRELIAEQVRRQIESLERIAVQEGAALGHVKLHGALYNAAAADGALARVVLPAIAAATRCRTLFVLAGSPLVAIARAEGFTVVEEAFPDRGYQGDGSLIPRGAPGALIEDPTEVARHAVQLAASGRAQTLCIHGDSENALRNAEAVVAALRMAGIAIRPTGGPP